ncbi:MAG: DoxX family protein [Chitinophagaceae bacterium]|nr:DoxX family protein [Chitinophagaceae bacterium]
MKKTNILFWIVTVLLCGYMVYSAIPGIRMTEKTIGVFAWLGYPKYFIPMISWAKLAGVVALLIPVKGFRTIKEWAYAGLFFDLAGALYSVYQMAGFFTDMLWFFILPIIFLFISYFLWRKKETAAVVA